MSKSVYQAFLIGALVFWGAVVLNLLVTFPAGFGPWLSIIGGVLLAVHAVDCLWYARRFGKSGNPTLLDAMLVLATGAVHGFWISRVGDEEEDLALV